MKYKLAFTFFLLLTGFFRQTKVIADELNTKIWEPAEGNKQIAIWPDGKMPDPLEIKKSESFDTVSKPLVAGKTWIDINNVTQPTMTIYTPKINNSGAAVVVFPGGGFNDLAIDLEGTEICDWLTSTGITCVLLKYRVPDSGPAWHDDCQCNIHPKAPTALQDAQRTLGLLRFNAAKWHIDANKIGVIGFSAGGYLVAQTSTNFKKRVYAPIDEADIESCRPDFAIALYPGHIQKENQHPKKFILNPNLDFTSDSPPTFLLQAQNDQVDNIENSLLYFKALTNVHVPVEMHIYAEGKHAFGLRPTKFQISKWPALVATWLHTIQVLKN